MDPDGYNVFVGSTTGMLKGISIGKDEVGIRTVTKNCLKGKENISNKNEITCLNWNNDTETEVLIGMKNRIRTYNTLTAEFSKDLEVPGSSICGIFQQNNTLFAGLSSGEIRSWESPYDESKYTDVLNCNSIERMKRSLVNSNIIATGGKENDLKLWDVETKKNTFTAKNIKLDELQLRVPVWISDITFFHDNEKISTCSRHGHVRLYDPRLPQRRPAINVHEPEQVFTCVSETPNENQLLVGSGNGNLFMVDLRNKNAFAAKYKGFSGGIKSVSCPRNENLVLSTSLDRHFRIHDITSRKLIVKEYLISRLTSTLTKEKFELKQFKREKNEEEEVDDENESNLSKFVTKKASLKQKKQLDKLFSQMEEVSEGKGTKMKKKASKRKETNTEEKEKESKKIKWKLRK